VSRNVQSIAIVGGGPAAHATAIHLARAGRSVGVFDTGKRPPLVVGESLVPAIVPLLQELGVEEEVASFSTYKPGATFVLDGGRKVRTLKFATIADATLTYAYNAPRAELDAALRRAAIAAGARIFPVHARLERDGEDGVRLHPDTLAATDGFFGPSGPDWIVDATGRTRALSKLLDLPADDGPRKDVALFAHLEGVPVVDEGHVHTDVLERGWAWRIPLPGRVSVGFVVPAEHAAAAGADREAMYHHLLAHDPVARTWGASARRVSPVLQYDNYQRVTRRGTGPGWSLVGDAFGFVDPVFSSGMLIGLTGARELARALVDGGDAALAAYERHTHHHLRSWHRAVSHFYDGRLFAVLDWGEAQERSFPGKLFAPHFRRHIPRVFTGESTTTAYSLGLLDALCRNRWLGDQGGAYAVG
jgi:flavin-dependent dehydrogenase